MPLGREPIYDTCGASYLMIGTKTILCDFRACEGEMVAGLLAKPGTEAEN